MIYFKRKDGSVFGKMDSVSKAQKSAYLKDGCVECDEQGAPVQKKFAKK